VESSRPVASRRSALTWWLFAAGLAIVITVAAVAASGGGGGEATRPEAFDLPALDGDGRVRLSDFSGTPVVVNFFATWCDACRFELPALAAAAQEVRGQVAFVGVNSLETGDGMRMAREFELEESGFVLARDVGGRQGSGLHDALGARGMPVTAFYDAAGRLIDLWAGALPEDALLGKLRQLYDVEV